MKADRLFHDWSLKLLALFLALFVWMRVVGEERYLLDMRVPLQVESLSSKLTFLRPAPSTVTVRLRARQATLEKIKAGDIDVRVNLSRARPGGNIYRLDPRGIKTPFGVEVVAVTPPSIRLDLSRKKSKMVPVIPDVRGHPPEDYELRGVSVTPKEVEVEGPGDLVAACIEISTEVILLAGRTSAFTERVALDPGDAALQVSPATTSVRILIGEKVGSKTLDKVPIELGDAGAQLQVRPGTVKVTVAGPVRLLRGLSAKELEVTLRPRDLAMLPAEVKPTVTLRTKALQTALKVRSVEPARVTVVPEVAHQEEQHQAAEGGSPS